MRIRSLCLIGHLVAAVLTGPAAPAVLAAQDPTTARG